MGQRPPLIVVLDRLIERHGLLPSAAIDVLTRAAHRKGCSLEELVVAITTGTPIGTSATPAGWPEPDSARTRP